MKKYKLCLSIFLFCSIRLFAQLNNSNQREVLLLGVFHFSNPGLDEVKLKSLDILSPQKQAEIQEVVNKLEEYKPDKIFVENLESHQAILDSIYEEYKKGRYTLTTNETDQLGIRLAAKLGHSRIMGIDYRLGLPFDTIFKVAIQHKQDYIIRNFRQRIDSIQNLINHTLVNKSIKEVLTWLNLPEINHANIHSYFGFFTAGDIKNHAAANIAASWYQRNMIIYDMFLKSLRPSDKKILVIFGQGHTAILHHFMSVNPEIKLADVNDVLNKK